VRLILTVFHRDDRLPRDTNLGSAPGLSTSVFQANVRITPYQGTSGIGAVGIGIVVGLDLRTLAVPHFPTGVIFVK
jgi:hypothetical protein